MPLKTCSICTEKYDTGACNPDHIIQGIVTIEKDTGHSLKNKRYHLCASCADMIEDHINHKAMMHRFQNIIK